MTNQTEALEACPHKNITTCPLYVAGHRNGYYQFSCVDGRLDEGGCAVSRGMNYNKSVLALRDAERKLQ